MALTVARLKDADGMIARFALKLNPDEQLVETLDPSYWAHVAANLFQFAKIDVVAADGSWYAELMVLEKTKNSAKVAVLRCVPLVAGVLKSIPPLAEKNTGEANAAGAAHYRKWNPSKQSFDVVRDSDKSVVAEGLNKADAVTKTDELNAQALAS